MVLIVEEPGNIRSQWKNVLRFRPEFHLIDTVLQRINDIAARHGVPYCASQWFHGEEGEPSSESVPAIGIKRATLKIAAESGADEREAKAVASLVATLMPPCCNGTCSQKRMPKPTTT